MSGSYSTWSTMLGVGLVMLLVGVRLNMLSLPEITSRCGACGRLLRRGAVCPCARLDDEPPVSPSERDSQ
jgi:hypothetical protein